jgi:subtilisin family serine protease
MTFPKRWIAGLGLGLCAAGLALAVLATPDGRGAVDSPMPGARSDRPDAKAPPAASPGPARAPAATTGLDVADVARGSADDSPDAPPAVPVAEPVRVSPASLDTAAPDTIRAVLSRAIEDARRVRPLAVSPEIVEAAALEGSVRVVFEASANVDAAGLARTLDSGGRTPSVDDLRVFPLLGQGAARLSPGALLNLIVETPTQTIELDGVHRASLLESVPQIGADVAHAATHDGDGFAVAVIDTGVDVDHPMFADRLIEEACFSLDDDCPNGMSQMLGDGAAVPCAIAGCDHGTHVAGIAVGDAESGPLVGVAPHAELIAINVFSDIDGEPGAYTSDILAAMQHVLALSAFHDVAAINLSLGGQAYSSVQSCNQGSPSQVNAIHQLRNAGIATVAASGNEFLTNAISSPGCLAKVISVGSVGGGDAVSSFSNSADFLTLLAPGESIQSAADGGGTRNGSGTSMATPHVAGAFAAIREAVPGASVDEIENALVLAGQPILDGRNGITTPRLRVDQTIAMLESAGPPSGGGEAAGDGGDGGSSGGGGGGGCGLVGLEPFLVLALARRGRARRRR